MKPWTDDEVSTLRHLITDKFSISDMSEVLDRSYNSVQKKVRSLDADGVTRDFGAFDASLERAFCASTGGFHDQEIKGLYPRDDKLNELQEHPHIITPRGHVVHGDFDGCGGDVGVVSHECFYKRALIIPDCHIPFHDKKAYAIMMNVGTDFDPHEIVILGDYADFYSVTSHAKDAGMDAVLNKELKIVHKHLSQLRDNFPHAKIVYIEGNHENRYTRYISGRAPELHGIHTVASLLELDKYGIEFIPYTPSQGHNVLGTKLIARHEPLGGGQSPARLTIHKGISSFVFGHTHRMEEAHSVSMGGKDFRAFSPGWLGDKKHQAFSYVKGHHQWQTGFALVYAKPSGNFIHNIVQVIDDEAVWDGKIYKA